MKISLSTLIVLTIFIQFAHAEQAIINFPPYNIGSTEILLKSEGEIDGDKYIIAMFTNNEINMPPRIHVLKINGKSIQLIAEVNAQRSEWIWSIWIIFISTR